MYTIVHKRTLNPSVTLMEIEAPLVAKRPVPASLLFCG